MPPLHFFDNCTLPALKCYTFFCHIADNHKPGLEQASSRNHIYDKFLTVTLPCKGGYFNAKTMGLVSGCAHFNYRTQC